MSKKQIAFSPDEFSDVSKEFTGVVSDADYGLEPLGIKGRPDIERREQLCVAIDTPDYEKRQYEWYAPTSHKKTKYAHFIEALATTGALRDADTSGETDEERMHNFVKSLIGMEFHWIQIEIEIMGGQRKTNVIIPDNYLGRKEVTPITEITTEEVEL